MSTQNQKPVNPHASSPESISSDSPNNGVSQRAHGISHQDREMRVANGENTEPVVTVTIPRTMQEKIKSLGQFMKLNTNELLKTSIGCIISYAEQKEIKIREIKGYPKEKNYNDFFTEKIDLIGKDLEELKKQNLLSDVSECAVLGLDFLYLRLIELNKVG